MKHARKRVCDRTAAILRQALRCAGLKQNAIAPGDKVLALQKIARREWKGPGARGTKSERIHRYF